ncbi:MAG TPA: DUF2794 domain-containing protein [Azospirillaceae bacterium]|nr:DUF2794 domain-containing protein [Azospirillaceae bacterium]
MTQIIHLADFRRPNGRRVYFNRSELTHLLQLYSTRVARGEWRDYAIDHTPGAALFSVFRHSFDKPLFAVAKYPGSGNRAVEYALVVGRRKVRRAGTLAELIEAFERAPHIVTDG